MTPAEILTCDVCHTPIEELNRGMVFWDDKPWQAVTVRPIVVTAFRLAHKSHRDNDDLGLSLELNWLSDPSVALYRLADMTIAYSWPVDYLARLVRIAWAVTQVSSQEQRAWSRELLETL